MDVKCLLIATEMLDIIDKINKKRKFVPCRTKRNGRPALTLQNYHIKKKYKLNT